MSEENDSHLTWVFEHPFATQLPVLSVPEEGKQWIIEFPFNGEQWYYWPWHWDLREEVVARTFEECLSLVYEKSNRSHPPEVPISRWRIRNVEKAEEVIYVGLII